MLGTLSEKMQGLMAKLAGKQKLTEDNISEAVNEVRLALLEADVNYGVTKILVRRVKKKRLATPSSNPFLPVNNSLKSYTMN